MWPNNPFRDTQITGYGANPRIIDWATDIGTITVIPFSTPPSVVRNRRAMVRGCRKTACKADPGSASYDAISGASTVSVKNTTDQVTLGIKNKFFDNRLQVNAEAFQLRPKNRPFNDPISFTVVVRLTPARRRRDPRV